MIAAKDAFVKQHRERLRPQYPEIRGGIGGIERVPITGLAYRNLYGFSRWFVIILLYRNLLWIDPFRFSFHPYKVVK